MPTSSTDWMTNSLVKWGVSDSAKQYAQENVTSNKLNSCLNFPRPADNPTPPTKIWGIGSSAAGYSGTFNQYNYAADLFQPPIPSNTWGFYSRGTTITRQKFDLTQAQIDAVKAGLRGPSSYR